PLAAQGRRAGPSRSPICSGETVQSGAPAKPERGTGLVYARGRSRLRSCATGARHVRRGRKRGTAELHEGSCGVPKGRRTRAARGTVSPRIDVRKGLGCSTQPGGCRTLVQAGCSGWVGGSSVCSWPAAIGIEQRQEKPRGSVRLVCERRRGRIGGSLTIVERIVPANDNWRNQSGAGTCSCHRSAVPSCCALSRSLRITLAL